MMEDISLRPESGFKTILKMLHECTTSTTQDGSGISISTNKPVVISAHAEQCFYAILFWIKAILTHIRPLSPGTFNALILKKYCKFYRNNKETEDKETEKIVTRPERFTEKMRFPKWFRQLDSCFFYSPERSDLPINYLRHLDTAPLARNDLITLPTLYGRQVRGTHHVGPAYKQDNGTLWSLIRDRMEDGPNWLRIRNFNTSCDGRGALIELIKSYKGSAYNKK